MRCMQLSTPRHLQYTSWTPNTVPKQNMCSTNGNQLQLLQLRASEDLDAGNHLDVPLIPTHVVAILTFNTARRSQRTSIFFKAFWTEDLPLKVEWGERVTAISSHPERRHTPLQKAYTTGIKRILYKPMVETNKGS